MAIVLPRQCCAGAELSYTVHISPTVGRDNGSAWLLGLLLLEFICCTYPPCGQHPPPCTTTHTPLHPTHTFCQLVPALSTCTGANLQPAPSYPLRSVCVGAHHLGCYSFKGCGSVEVVTLLTDTIPVLDWPRGDARGSKGSLVVPASGPVVGLQDCPLLLPAVLPVLRKAWRAAEEAVGNIQCVESSG